MVFSSLGFLHCAVRILSLSLCAHVWNVLLRNMPKSEITGSQVIYILSFIYTATFYKMVPVCNPSSSVREFDSPRPSLTLSSMIYVYGELKCQEFQNSPNPTTPTPTFPDAQIWAPGRISKLFTEVKNHSEKYNQPSTQLGTDLFLLMWKRIIVLPFNPFWSSSSFSILSSLNIHPSLPPS